MHLSCITISLIDRILSHKGYHVHVYLDDQDFGELSFLQALFLMEKKSFVKAFRNRHCHPEHRIETRLSRGEYEYLGTLMSIVRLNGVVNPDWIKKGVSQFPWTWNEFLRQIAGSQEVISRTFNDALLHIYEEFRLDGVPVKLNSLLAEALLMDINNTPSDGMKDLFDMLVRAMTGKCRFDMDMVLSQAPYLNMVVIDSIRMDPFSFVHLPLYSLGSQTYDLNQLMDVEYERFLMEYIIPLTFTPFESNEYDILVFIRNIYLEFSPWSPFNHKTLLPSYILSLPNLLHPEVVTNQLLLYPLLQFISIHDQKVVLLVHHTAVLSRISNGSILPGPPESLPLNYLSFLSRMNEYAALRRVGPGELSGLIGLVSMIDGMDSLRDITSAAFMTPGIHDCDRMYLATLAMLSGETMSVPVMEYIMDRECEYCQWCETCKWLVSGKAMYLFKAALSREPFIVILLIAADLLSSRNLSHVHMSSLVHRYGLLDMRYLRVLNVIFHHVAPLAYSHVTGFTERLIPHGEDLLSMSFRDGIPWGNMAGLFPAILCLSGMMVSHGNRMTLPFRKDFSFQLGLHMMIHQVMEAE
jgi:hypothetical protein